MKLKCRLTHNLAEIKVDEIEVTLFKSHPQEIDDMINNLLDIVDDLKKLKGEIEEQQQGYSEEEVIAFGEFIFKHTLLAHSKGVKNLFEQFKKK